MAKRVQFAQLNASYSSGSCTPSPSHSLSSLPSDSDPPTPPISYTPMFHPRSHLDSKPSPLPSHSVDEIFIHKFLNFSPHEPPALPYDIYDPPYLLLRDPLLSFATFDLAATEPPVCELEIRLPHLLPVFVRCTRQSYVTIYDVLQALHCELWQPTSQHEYESLPSDVKYRVDRSFFARCKSFSDESNHQSLGVRRIDFLMGKTRFLGLSKDDRNIWTLHVSSTHGW